MAGEPKPTPFTQPIVGASTEPLATPPAATSLGQLGRYELLSLLAKGGMGEVFLARSRSIGGFEKLVVIKRNLPSIDVERDPLFAEARLVATLQHTNIVQVYDVDIDGPTVFIAMEFLHGQDVRHVLKRSWGDGKRLPLDHAIAIVLAACAGLHYAHEKREGDGKRLEIVHRDVSPSNVFVTYDGGVKLIDFGIAKPTALPSETQLGTVKGKPGYMSPEQCRGEPLDRRSDLFCVGILLYELTTGRRPFHSSNEYLTYHRICEDEPVRPSELDPAYPVALEAIVLRALSKDRRARHATAQALQEDLSRLAGELRLDVSQFALARYMDDTFRSELDAWREAQQSGRSLVEHVLRTTGTVPVVREVASPPSTVSSSALSIDTVAGPRTGRVRVLVVAGAVAIVGVFAAIALTSNDAPDRTSPATALPIPKSPAIVDEPIVTKPPADVPAKVTSTTPIVDEPVAAKPPVRTEAKPTRPKPSRSVKPRPTSPPRDLQAGSGTPAATKQRGPDDPIIED